MKKYYRVILGRQHKHFKDCYDGKFIGVGFIVDINLKNDLLDDLDKLLLCHSSEPIVDTSIYASFKVFHINQIS